MKANTSAVFTLMVDNEFGVLTRITALIRRAGWNIRSLAVAETAKPEVSRLAVCLECRHHSLENVLDRLGRFACVREISLFSPEAQVARELALAHLRSDDEGGIRALCEKLDARILEREDNNYILSLVCEPNLLDELIDELREYGLVDIARTGAISLRRADLS